MNQGLERLTLLPGPTLLSPARTTATMMPSPLKLGTESPAFAQSLELSRPVSPAKAVFVPGKIMPMLRGAKPSAELLRFDATLEPVNVAPQFRFVPGPKPAGR